MPHRRCNVCGNDYPHTVEFFHRDGKGLRTTCKQCAIARTRRWVRANRDRLQRWSRQYYWAHREALLEKNREWRRANPDKYRAIKKRQFHMRRARLIQATGTHSPDDVLRIYKQQGGRCYYCAHQLRQRYHVDHMIPLCRGGSNGPDNICCPCAS